MGGLDSGVVLLGVVYNLVRRHRGMGRMVGTEEEVMEDRQKQVASLTDFLLQRQQQLTQQPQRPANDTDPDSPDGDDLDDDADDVDSSAPAKGAAQPDPLSTLQASSAPTGNEMRSLGLASGFTADSFDAQTSDLEKTSAERSTLWEVRTLTHHYDPTLSALAATFYAQNAPKQGVDVAEYEGLSYEALKAKELERRKHQKVPVNYVKRTKLFSDGEIFAVNFQV